MKYKLTKRALDDIEEIGVYIAERNQQAADRFVEAIFHRLEMLERVPRAGARRDDLGIGLRSVAIGQYLIIYKVGDTRIEVARVVHGKRDIPKLLKKPMKPNPKRS